ncbi:MAG: uroporphyrinogen-III synthase [Rhizobiales bacterium]|nr:uroporphyrinogen-III synthase [Hyphomicrobiales bacterium]
MKILVTRPAHDQAALAARLEALGHEAVPFPLLTIEPLEFSLPDLSGFMGLVFTSANGVRATIGKMDVDKSSNLQVLTVGDVTAAAVREAGFANVVPAGDNVDDLGAHLVKTYGGKDNKFLHLAGTSRAGDLNSLTGPGGPAIEVIEVYRAVAAADLTDLVVASIKANQIDGAILMSPRTAEIYASLILDAGFGSGAGKYVHYCLSANVAKALDPLQLPQNRVEIAMRPDLEMLLALIGK